MTSDETPFPWRRFLGPRYWIIWIALGLFRAMVWLPFRIQVAIGTVIGHGGRLFMGRRRKIAAINLKLCYPELDEAARDKLLRAQFVSLGIGMIEVANCWWATDKALRSRVTIEGKEHLDVARGAGRPIILLSAHFTTLEIGGRLLGLFTPFHLMYRPSKNPMLEEVIRRNRERHFEKAIPRDSVKDMLRSLKDGMPVWYAPDQSYRHRNSVLAPFFGIPVATNTATSRLARTTNAVVIPYLVRRLPGNTRYHLTLGEPLADFPSDDIMKDAIEVNAMFEAAVRQAPEQYLWIHRRFKPLEGQENPYGDL